MTFMGSGCGHSHLHDAPAPQRRGKVRAPGQHLEEAALSSWRKPEQKLRASDLKSTPSEHDFKTIFPHTGFLFPLSLTSPLNFPLCLQYCPGLSHVE